MSEPSKEELLAEIERLKQALAAQETDERPTNIDNDLHDSALVSGDHNQLDVPRSTFEQSKQEVGQQVNVAGDNLSVRYIRNVYAQAPGEPALDETAFDEALGRYVAWVHNRYGQLRLRGIEQREQQALSLTLNNVYVSLIASVTPDRKQARRQSRRPVSEAQKAIASYQLMPICG